ncbi:hypothetical protein GGER_19410 [Serratia rubidaea]
MDKARAAAVPRPQPNKKSAKNAPKFVSKYDYFCVFLELYHITLVTFAPRCRLYIAKVAL